MGIKDHWPPNTTEDDPKLKWPYQEHAKLARGSSLSDDEMLDILNDLMKQHEYAKTLSCKVRTLRAEVEALRAENKFLTEQLNDQPSDF